MFVSQRGQMRGDGQMYFVYYAAKAGRQSLALQKIVDPGAVD